MDGSLSPQAPTRKAQRGNAESHHIVIAGSGFAGLGMAIRLKQAGIEDFIVLEQAADVGGTWRDNTYPGCACDVPSPLYSFSFAPNPNWSQLYGRQPEIQGYLKDCAQRFGVLPHLRFNTGLAKAEWQEDLGRWQLTTRAGEVLLAQYFVPAVGGLSRPAYPDINGLSSFKGSVFHSQQWQHQVSLKGKRVAVIGTGASAIQFVPEIQPEVAELTLYQRTPPWIIPKANRQIGAAGKALFARVPLVQKALRAAIYSLQETTALGFAVNPKLMALPQKLALNHLAKQVPNAALRQQLTPNYTIGCKRILISNNYYPALSKANVQVVAQGIKKVTATGVIDSQGVARAADVIILGTGFHVTNPVPEGLILGKGGVDLASLWKSGPEAYKGTTISGFPNLFMIVGPNVGLGHNSMVYMIESQVQYVMDALKTLKAKNAVGFDVRPEVQQRFNAKLQAQLGEAVWAAGGCKSWYVHESGKNTSLWPGFTFSFRQATRRFDTAAYTLKRLGVDAKA